MTCLKHPSSCVERVSYKSEHLITVKDVVTRDGDESFNEHVLPTNNGVGRLA